jgi:hypothetical protein
MTPKEKAEELVLTYLRIDNNTKEWFNKHIAKQCALIAVDEMMKIAYYEYMESYYLEVKSEIEKL